MLSLSPSRARATLVLFAAVFVFAALEVSAPSLSAQDEATSTKLRSDRAKTYAAFAKAHVKVGDRLKEKRFYATAKWHYQRAQFLVPNFTPAMQGLGYVKTGEDWELKKPLADVDMGGLDSKSAKVRLKATEFWKTVNTDWMSFVEMEAPTLRRLVVDFEDAKLVPESREIARQLIEYQPDDAVARRVRGHLRHKRLGAWLPPSTFAAYESADKLAKRLLAPTEGEIPDDIKALTNVELHGMKAERVLVVTDIDKQAAREFASVLQVAVHYLSTITGIERENLTGKRLEVFVARSDELYQAWISKVAKLSDTRRLSAARSSGVIEDGGQRVFAKERKPKDDDIDSHDSSRKRSKDLVLHTCSIAFLNHGRNGVAPPWLKAGFSHFVASRVLNTTFSRLYSGVYSRRTDPRPEEEQRGRGNPYDPEEMRNIAMERVDFGQDIPLAELAVQNQNDVNPAMAAKAMSIVEFAFDKHPEKARKWFATRVVRSKRELEKVSKTFEMTPEEFEKAWRKWVIETY